MPTAEALLREARLALQAAGVSSAALDARLLLQAAGGISQQALIADSGMDIAEDAAVQFQRWVQRRVAREPVSRILGSREFYGREFKVTPAVLDPRADTECLIGLCLAALPADRPSHILDLGTGSGIVALTLLAERPLARAVAVDISVAALAVAQENAKALGVSQRCSFHAGKWFSGIEDAFDLIVSNPPYIESGAIAGLEVDVKDHDPLLALDGGADGLDAYRAIAGGAAGVLAAGGALVVEIGAGQAADVGLIFARNGFSLAEQARDLGGHLRALRFKSA